MDHPVYQRDFGISAFRMPRRDKVFPDLYAPIARDTTIKKSFKSVNESAGIQ